MGASPAVLCSAWLAEPRFTARVYGYGSTALPVFIVQWICRVTIEDLRADRLLWPPRPPPNSTRFPPPRPIRRPEQFGRSEAEAKLLRSGLDPRTTLASCEAIRGPDHGTLGLEPARPRSPPEVPPQ